MTLTSTVALVVTMVLMSATPGPLDVVLVAYTSQRGWKAALLMVLGIITADFVFIGAALAGLGYVAQNFAPAFVVVRLLAIGLLAWFGWRYLTAGPGTSSPGNRETHPNGFFSGFLLTFGDPKAILFYMSLLPAYLDMQSASLTDALVIMLSATFAIGLAKTFYIGMTHRAQNWLGSGSVQGVMHKLAGGLLCAVGLYLLLQLVLEYR